MAYQKLQVGNALNVIPSDTINIPNPALKAVSSVNTGGEANAIIDDTVNFNALQIVIGSVIINETSGLISTVTSIISDTELGLADDIFTTTGNSYSVYSPEPREGCVLYVGTGGDVNITTWGGQTVLFKNVSSGSYIPVQTRRVNSSLTSASNIVALW